MSESQSENQISVLFATPDDLTHAVMQVINAAELAQRAHARNGEVSNIVTMGLLCLAAGAQVTIHNTQAARDRTDEEILAMLRMKPADCDKLFSLFGADFLRLAAVMRTMGIPPTENQTIH